MIFFTKCPVCGQKIVEQYSFSSPYGVEEYSRGCKNKCFVEEFMYGNYMIHLPYTTIGYNYTTTEKQKDDIYALVVAESKKTKRRFGYWWRRLFR